MELTQTTPDEILTSLTTQFGPLREGESYSRSTLANLCRHIAGRQCPLPTRALLKTIAEPLEAAGLTNIREAVDDIVETLIAQGDLLELAGVTGGTDAVTETLLYAAPPQFVELSDKRVVLLGIAADNVAILPEDLYTKIDQVDCLRLIETSSEQNLGGQLQDLGVYQIDAATWLRAPAIEDPEGHRARFDEALTASGPSGEIPGLTILDPDRPPTYYLGRWRDPGSSDTGNYVSRRSAGYGNPIWCYVALEGGVPMQLLDLPMRSMAERGCDQAWRLQAAIDAMLGTPQAVEVGERRNNMRQITVKSPIPKWLERRWTIGGARVKPRGSLAGFWLPNNDMDTELNFAKERMWLQTEE